MVSAPALGRRWWASKGGGAFTGRSILNAPELRVSKVEQVEDSSLSYSSIDGWVDSGRGQGFINLMRASWRRRCNSLRMRQRPVWSVWLRAVPGWCNACKKTWG